MVKQKYLTKGRIGKKHSLTGTAVPCITLVGLVSCFLHLVFHLKEASLDSIFALKFAALSPEEMERSPHITSPIIPEEEQWTVEDRNYSVINRGIFADGKWKSRRNASNIPPLFMDRLNKYLPECPPITGTTAPANYTPCDYHTKRLFPRDVEQMERDILQFHIPRKIVIVWAEFAEYVSLQHWRWNTILDALNQTTGTRQQCPNCHIRFPHGTHFHKPNLSEEPAHVRIFPSCHAHKRIMEHGRDFPGQLLVGDCGESQAGTGAMYWRGGTKTVDYDMSFVDQGSPLVRTWAHLHLSPDKVYAQSGLKPLHNVTDFVRQLLAPVPAFPRHVNNTEVRERILQEGGSIDLLEQASNKYDVSFMHNNCGRRRGSLVKQMIESASQTNISIARYGRCSQNVKTNDIMGGGWDGSPREPQNLLHEDFEGHRDASKTVLVSHHKFGIALENTLSPYYFTEKRWQVLLAASVPIVWDNHNSLQYLPDPDAALVINTTDATTIDQATELAKLIHYYAQPQNENEYLERFFAWKKRGLRADFVRKLFMSSDFLLCRVCEYAAHHHFYED